MADTPLRDQVVVVTGAAGRLGQHVVERFGEAGSSLAAVDLSEQQLEQIAFPEGEEGSTHAADLTDEAAVERCFEDIANQHGRIDVLFHTVGAWDGKPLLDTSLDAWEQMIHVNLRSAFLCFREAARMMTRDTREHPGRLIGMASGQGADRGQAEQGGYSAAKAGVVRLVEAVADEFDADELTAHAIAPSVILFGEGSGQEGVPATRIADLGAYLCSGAGNALNGAVLRTYGTAY